MEGKIGNTGQLFIKRGSRWAGQYCPMSQNDANCGDHCTCFGEPEQVRKYYYNFAERKKEERDYIRLIVCHGQLHFEILIDERE